MIVVKVELWPGGDKERAQLLGVATIANDMSGTRTSGNYQAAIAHRGEVWRTPEVKGFPRQRLNVWYLLHRVLSAAVSSEFPQKANKETE